MFHHTTTSLSYRVASRGCDKYWVERRALVGVYCRNAKILLYCGELVQGGGSYFDVGLHESWNQPYGIIITPR